MQKLLSQICQSFENDKELGVTHLEVLAVFIASLTFKGDDNFFIITEDRSYFSSLIIDLQTHFDVAEVDKDVLIFPEILPPLSRFAVENYGEAYAFLINLPKLLTPSLILLTLDDYNRLYPNPEDLSKKKITIEVKSKVQMASLRQQLIDWGYDYEEQVDILGEFACRGGIFDIFSPLYANPFRLEFFGDEIDSIRQFDTQTQRSLKEVDSFDIIPYQLEEKTVSIKTYFHGGKIIFINSNNKNSDVEADLVVHCQENFYNNSLSALAPLYNSSLREIKMQYGQLQRKLLFMQVERWLESKYELIFFCGHLSRVKRLKEIFKKETNFDISNIIFDSRSLNHGFIFVDKKIIVLSEDEIFGRLQVYKKDRQEEEKGKVNIESSFEQLTAGNYAVHAIYGICQYQGIEIITSNEEENECMILQFDEDKKIFLPLSYAYLVTNYKGGRKDLPKLSSINSTLWRKGRDKVIGAIKDVAVQLLRLQAVRKSSVGYQFSEDNEWEYSFAQSFSFVETIDQRQAIEDVKLDMQRVQPMDRLLCGDVGFGKTEVAMRAAFKAVMNSKQAVIIAPTTILSQQHFINFSKRMADYPINIAVLNRLVSTVKQKEILESLMFGKIDIIIGTHRLIQKDINFCDLGLVIIDEEQKFGVESKEALKHFKLSVDVLAMTATPIPRTLYHSLAGLRDLSTITTPPKDRKAVKTIVVNYDEEIIIKAIKYEVARGGQVYFLHNRVASIDKICERLKLILPENIRLAVGHGQLEKNELENVMNAFFEHRIDVLVCTTIIESGLDVANANTIIIDRADNFGLSSLYQLRGRVGRDVNQAYAYFFILDEGLLTSDARKRLSAMTRYTQLGAGLKLALRDLEIRGAGNLLGMEQSGHISQVGFELYCQLLKQEVASLKDGETRTFIHLLDIELDFLAFSLKNRQKELACFPPSYIENVTTRMEFYKFLQHLEDISKLDEFAEALRDRFGNFPQEVMNLLLYSRVKINMLKNNYQTLRTYGKNIFLKDIHNSIIKDNKTKDYFKIVDGDAQKRLIQLINITSKVNGV